MQEHEQLHNMEKRAAAILLFLAAFLRSEISCGTIRSCVYAEWYQDPQPMNGNSLAELKKERL